MCLKLPSSVDLVVVVQKFFLLLLVAGAGSAFIVLTTASHGRRFCACPSRSFFAKRRCYQPARYKKSYIRLIAQPSTIHCQRLVSVFIGTKHQALGIIRICSNHQRFLEVLSCLGGLGAMSSGLLWFKCPPLTTPLTASQVVLRIIP